MRYIIYATKYFHKSIVKYCSIYISECKRQKNCQITLMYNELCPILRQRHNVIKVPFNHRNSVWQLWNTSIAYSSAFSITVENRHTLLQVLMLTCCTEYIQCGNTNLHVQDYHRLWYHLLSGRPNSSNCVRHQIHFNLRFQ